MTVPQAPFPVVVTKEAAEKVLETLVSSNLDQANTYLQVGIRGGGCAGYQYTMDFKEGPIPEDWSIDTQYGVMVAVDPMSGTLLGGTTVDFVNELMGSGFKFDNPSAQRNCGCGSSFG